MSFAALLQRIDAQLDLSRHRGVPSVTVSACDLAELLQQFRRMDAVDRLHYPAHVTMLADAAQEVVQHYGAQGGAAALADLRFALLISRPNRRPK